MAGDSMHVLVGMTETAGEIKLSVQDGDKTASIRMNKFAAGCLVRLLLQAIDDCKENPPSPPPDQPKTNVYNDIINAK